MHDDDTPIETSEREAQPWSPEMQTTVAGRQLSLEVILARFVELLIPGQDSGNLLADAQTALAVLIEGLLEKREAPCVPANAIEGITGPHNACMFREHCRALLAAPQPARALCKCEQQALGNALKASVRIVDAPQPAQAVVEAAGRVLNETEANGDGSRFTADLRTLAEFVLNAAPSAQAEAQPVTADVTAWLIESNCGPHALYWTGALQVTDGAHRGVQLGLSVTADANAAVRFVSKDLAEAALASMQSDYRVSIGSGIFQAAEHMWPAPSAQAEPAPEEVGCPRCGHKFWIQEGKAPAQVCAPQAEQGGE